MRTPVKVRKIMLPSNYKRKIIGMFVHFLKKEKQKKD